MMWDGKKALSQRIFKEVSTCHILVMTAVISQIWTLVEVKGIYHRTALCDRFNLNTSDSEIMISEFRCIV